MDPFSLVGTGLGIAEQTSAAGKVQEANAEWNDRSYVNIAPVGVNLGAILDPYNQGSAQNGGFGLELMSRYAPAARDNASLSVSAGLGSYLLPILLLGGGLLVFMFLRK